MIETFELGMLKLEKASYSVVDHLDWCLSNFTYEFLGDLIKSSDSDSVSME